MGKMCFRASLFLIFATSMLIAAVTIYPASAPATTVGVEPDMKIDLALQAGSTFKVGVWVRNVADLVGVDFKLEYNTTILTATLIEYGGIFGENYFPWASTINDTRGQLHYSITTAFGEPTFTGDGRVANITFTVDSYGSSPLDLYETKLTDSQIPPNPIEHTVIDGYFRNTLPGDIQGDAPGTPPDGDVDYYDFLAFAAAYLKILGQPGYNIEADLQGDAPGTLPDGDVDYYDFLIFASNYLKTMP